MNRIFQISAVILGGIAAYFLWTKNGDYAFAAGILAAVSFFLSIRTQIKGRLTEHERERLELEDEELLRLEEAENNSDFAVIENENFAREKRESR